MNKKNLKNKKAFSLIELSIVILIVGIVVAGVTQASRLVGAFKLSAARNITQSSPVNSIRDLVLWLEPTSERAFADANTNYSLEDGDSVQTWFDSNPQVTSRKDFAAPASNKRPLFKLSGINSLPSAQFSHSSAKYFENTSGIIPSGDATYTIFIVHKLTSFTNGQYYFSFSQSSAAGVTGGMASIIYYASNGYGLGFAACNNDYYTGVNAVANRVAITGATLNSTALNVYNSSLTALSTTLAASAANGMGGLVTRIGTAPYNETDLYEGLISEIIVYDRVLKTEELQSIMTYLAKKYAVTLS